MDTDAVGSTIKTLGEPSDGALQWQATNQRGNSTVFVENSAHVASTYTDRTVLVQNPKDQEDAHIHAFPTFDSFKISWVVKGAEVDGIGPVPTCLLHGSTVVDLKAGATCFVLLTDAGEVYSWGDSRHARCLARAPTIEAPAEKPSLVEDLGGVPIKKVDGSGWVFGALSREGDLYVWGNPHQVRHQPGLDTLFNMEGEFQLVDIPGVDCIIDFAMGTAHVVVVAKGGDLWGVGDNSCGQLGLGKESHVTDWTRLGPHAATSVVCGALTTFITAA